MLVVTARVHDQNGSGDLLSSLLQSLSWQLSKQLINLPEMLLLGREKECVLNHCFTFLQFVQTVSVSPALLRALPKER
jgi:hypothetical protein